MNSRNGRRFVKRYNSPEDAFVDLSASINRLYDVSGDIEEKMTLITFSDNPAVREWADNSGKIGAAVTLLGLVTRAVNEASLGHDDAFANCVIAIAKVANRYLEG